MADISNSFLTHTKTHTHPHTHSHTSQKANEKDMAYICWKGWGWIRMFRIYIKNIGLNKKQFVNLNLSWNSRKYKVLIIANIVW